MISKKPELSIIILGYNTKALLDDCLSSIKKHSDEVSLEVIVSDNASSDGSVDMVREKYPWAKLTQGPNVGFSKGNNRARKLTRGKMVLFLNPDTKINKNVLKETTNYLKKYRDVGALSCKLVLPSGKLDKDARRRFPTPGIAFAKLFLGNGRKYWYEDISANKVHEVDAIEGAFILTWKKILDSVGWFDEDYFFNGEDIDLCWKIRQKGWKIIYYPKVFIYHLKGVTTGKSKQWKVKSSLVKRIKIKLITVESMELFFRKNLWKRYPIFFDWFVILGINIFKVLRTARVVISSITK
ncbi:glycosyltransferase family 2 protein [Patescibacteria group bacterium]